jgi:hypothetical protein
MQAHRISRLRECPFITDAVWSDSDGHGYELPLRHGRVS